MHQKIPKSLIALLGCVFALNTASAELVMQMNLGELTDNAARIFRGTVMRVESDTVTAGGSELPAVRYVIAVSETVKGESAASDGKGGAIIELKMIGSLKNVQPSADLVRINSFEPPRLLQGEEYLLFTTAASSIGLSMTVGVGQGAFKFVGDGDVVNELQNAGLFRGMDRGGLPASGPISYSRLLDRVQSEMNN